jgi:hypothetical protein
VWLATSTQISLGELDVRDANGDDLAHIGPFGPWPAASGQNGYALVPMSFTVRDNGPLYFVAGLWGDGSTNHSQWIRIDDLSVSCNVGN